jgi:hypothetical protein
MDNHIRKPNQVEWRDATDVYSGAVPFETQPGRCLVWQVFGIFSESLLEKMIYFRIRSDSLLCAYSTFHYFMVWDTDNIAYTT